MRGQPQRHNLWGMRGSLFPQAFVDGTLLTSTNIDVSGGTSGSGVLRNDVPGHEGEYFVVGVLVASATQNDGATICINLAARLTDEMIALIGEAQQEIVCA